MRNNKFDTLPESGLSGLRQIDVRGNPLTSVPQALADLPKLEKLDLGWISNLQLPVWINDLEARGCAVYR